MTTPTKEDPIEEIRRVVALTYDEVSTLRARVEELANNVGGELRDLKHRVRLLEQSEDASRAGAGNGAAE